MKNKAKKEKFIKTMRKAIISTCIEDVEQCLDSAKNDGIDLIQSMSKEKLSKWNDGFKMLSAFYLIQDSAKALKVMEFLIDKKLSLTKESAMHLRIRDSNLLYQSIINDNVKLLECFITAGISPNSKIAEYKLDSEKIRQEESELTLLYLANWHVAHKCQAFLLEKGGSIIEGEPLCHYASKQELAALLEDKNGEVNIAQLLKYNGYDPIIRSQYLVLSSESVDMSGLIIKSSEIKANSELVNLNFGDVVMEDCIIVSAKDVNIQPSSAKFINSCVLTINNRFATSMKPYCDNVLFFSSYFKQTAIMKKYSQVGQDGICAGMVIDYARYNFAKKDRRISYAAKLQHKLDKNDVVFAERLDFYWASSSTLYKSNTKGEYIASFPKIGQALEFVKVTDASILYVSFYTMRAAHAIAIKIIDYAQERKYTLYDPNFGETNELDFAELMSGMRAIEVVYEGANFVFKNGQYFIDGLSKATNQNDKHSKYLAKNPHLLKHAIASDDRKNIIEHLNNVEMEESLLINDISDWFRLKALSETRMEIFSTLPDKTKRFSKIYSKSEKIANFNSRELIWLQSTGMSKKTIMNLLVLHDIALDVDLISKLAFNDDDIKVLYSQADDKKYKLKPSILIYMLKGNLLSEKDIEQLLIRSYALLRFDKEYRPILASCFQYEKIRDSFVNRTSVFGHNRYLKLYDFFKDALTFEQKVGLIAACAKHDNDHMDVAYTFNKMINDFSRMEKMTLAAEHHDVLEYIVPCILNNFLCEYITQAVISTRMPGALGMQFVDSNVLNSITFSLENQDIEYETLKKNVIRIVHYDYSIIEIIANALQQSIEKEYYARRGNRLELEEDSLFF